MVAKNVAAQFEKQDLHEVKDTTTQSGVHAVEDKGINLFGALKGTVKIRGNIVDPIDEAWG